MRAALSDLAATAEHSAAARRVAVLGDMLELGPEARSYHAQLGELAGDAGVDVLVTVGPLAAAITERFPGQAISFADSEEAAAVVPELLEPGDLVLVKGSLGVGLKRVCDALGVGAAA
jgi:UDP-N-acetylmuramyl pentapeptide synthase